MDSSGIDDFISGWEGGRTWSEEEGWTANDSPRWSDRVEMSAEILGSRLLAEVREESLDEVCVGLL